MIGAILGDIIGSPFEFDRGEKTKHFPLFSEDSHFTDDTVMTIAVAEAFMNTREKSDFEIKEALINSMKKWGRKYPHAGYGGKFALWLRLDDREPYNSWGNGSAMRVSSVAWLEHDIEKVRHAARLSAEVTHNHPEGMKGAEATASAIYMARTGSSKKDIRAYITQAFQYDLSRTCDEIRMNYQHVESCMESVPEAITAFLEGESFEDVIRLTISLGGDTDTLAAISGSIAEAYYGVSEELWQEGCERLPSDILEVIEMFQKVLK